MSMTYSPEIICTKVDEAPQLALASVLPIIQSFAGAAGAAGVSVGTRDISLAGHIIAAFPEYLEESQRQPDDLADLGGYYHTDPAKIDQVMRPSPTLLSILSGSQALRPAAALIGRRSCGSGLQPRPDGDEV
jgi:isocitrate dehydrogenase